MHINDQNLNTVKDILHRTLPNTTVWAFGSRVHGKQVQKFSDFDLVIVQEQPLPLKTLAAVQKSFSDSDLPFMVDLVEWATIDENFRSIIKQQYEVIQ